MDLAGSFVLSLAGVDWAVLGMLVLSLAGVDWAVLGLRGGTEVLHGELEEQVTEALATSSSSFDEEVLACCGELGVGVEDLFDKFKVWFDADGAEVKLIETLLD